MKKISLALILMTILALLPLARVVQADSVPTISIQGVTKDDKVYVVTHDFPAKREFIARMGKFGTKGIDGIQVGKVDSASGGSLKFTFVIPDSLHGESKIAIRLESTTGGYFSYNWFTNSTFGTHTGGIPAEEITLPPQIIIASVKKDTLVIVKGLDFPKDETFDVLIGKEGTKGIDGVLVDTIDLNGESAFTLSFNIPESLKSEEKLAIRFESKESDLVAYADFKNETGACGGTIGNGGSVYSTIPTISILSVEKGKTVTLRTYNFPANKDFKVLMGKMGTRGVAGIQVTTFNSGSGGSFTKTFDIPDSLKSDYQVAIRLQTSDGVFYAFNWFYNNTTSNGTTPPGYTGIPTFSIIGVDAGNQVTIKTNNFPANIDFKVLMGKMGTKGIGGTVVTQINSGTGGIFTKSFTIPASLAGDGRIAIRLEALSGGFYAYNWFYNADYP